MRYFLLAGTKSALTFGVVQTPAAGCPVARIGATKGRPARQDRAAIGAVHIAAITPTAQHHLAVTACTIEQSGGQLHRHPVPMSAGKAGRRMPH